MAARSRMPPATSTPFPNACTMRTDEITRDRPTAAGTLEIDHVQMPRHTSPRRRESRRIVVVDGDLVVVALVKANRLASEQIDRRPELHGCLAFQKRGEKREPRRLALLGVELRRENVVARDRGGHLERAVLHGRHHERAIARARRGRSE